MTDLDSGIYQGVVTHKRFGEKQHQFRYQMYMLSLNLDELEDVLKISRLFGRKWYQPLSFSHRDHIDCDPQEFKPRIIEKAVALGAVLNKTETQVVLLTQVRCFGLYFSPVNFYFFKEDQSVSYMMAEVSNTPWNERHYYLVNYNEQQATEKTFVVSPFMDLDMDYHWRIKAPGKTAEVRIDNIRADGSRVFTAALALKRQGLSSTNIRQLVFRQPVMTAKIKLAIYWQAVKLLIKKVPFVGHLGHKDTQKV